MSYFFKIIYAMVLIFLCVLEGLFKVTKELLGLGLFAICGKLLANSDDLFAVLLLLAIFTGVFAISWDLLAISEVLFADSLLLAIERVTCKLITTNK